MNVRGWTSTVNRQVPEEWVNILIIRSTWIYTWSPNEVGRTSEKRWVHFYMATKNTGMTNRKFSWWNEDEMETGNGAGYWRNPEQALNCTLRPCSLESSFLHYSFCVQFLPQIFSLFVINYCLAAVLRTNKKLTIYIAVSRQSTCKLLWAT